MKETIENTHYQEKVTLLIEFVLPFPVGVSELQIRLGSNLRSYILFCDFVGILERINTFLTEDILNRDNS